MAIISVNPATEEVLTVLEEYDTSKTNAIIKQTFSEWQSWKLTTFSHRKKCMINLAEILSDKKNDLARLITIEMGKPVKQAEAEIEKCAWLCKFYAENAEQYLKKEIMKTDAAESYIIHNPLGIVLAVMPWNYPFWQVFRFAVPALMAGNAAILKHASNVPQCAIAIENLFRSSGFPENLFRTLLISSTQVSQVIENPLIKAVTLTGSEPAGRKVAEISGRNLKKTVLELGGSDPFIVFEDADISEAVKSAVTGRILNNGQSCIAAKRFIIVGKAAVRFIPEFTGQMESLKIGNPLDPENELGPLSRKDLVVELRDQIELSVKLGAKKITGDIHLPDKGFYSPPVVLCEITPGMPAYSEEFFGPAASVITVPNEEEAIRIANDTSFGLGASLWTTDLHKAEKYIPLIDAGAVFVNGIVKSDPRLPFGGIKNSGYGRELSYHGIKEFVNIKTVWIK